MHYIYIYIYNSWNSWKFNCDPWVSWSFLPDDCCFAKNSMKLGLQSKFHELNIYIQYIYNIYIYIYIYIYI